MRTRFARQKRRKIGPWPNDELSPEQVADAAAYVGSPEHKSHPSVAGVPALRSDASKCEPAMTRNAARNTRALQEGIRRRCTSSVFENGFPRYVWTYVDGDVFEARHIRGPAGTYKGYKLEAAEMPDDPLKLLDWES